jgi:hypothetical protein
MGCGDGPEVLMSRVVFDQPDSRLTWTQLGCVCAIGAVTWVGTILLVLAVLG